MKQIESTESNTGIIPLFPLPLAVLPGELLPLHIFEPRYRELIAHCLGAQSASQLGEQNTGPTKPFGISPYLDERVSDLGCSVEIAEVLHEFNDGRSVVLTMGRSPYRILEFYSSGRYPAAKVEYIQQLPEPADEELRQDSLALLMELCKAEQREEVFQDEDFSKYLSFEIANATQLDVMEKEELLAEQNENERLRRLADFIRFRLGSLESVANDPFRIIPKTSAPTIH